MNLESILTYPTERDDWVKTVLVGGLLLLFSFLVVPALLAFGYVVRAIRGSLAGETEPPAFDDWGDLLVDGLKGWAIGLVYMLIPAIVATVVLGGSIVALVTGALSGSDAGIAAGLGGLALALLLSTVLTLVFGYLAVVGLVNFVSEDRLGAAFDVSVVRSVALDSRYAVPWLVSVAIFFVLGLVTMIPAIGWLLAPFATFYGAVVAADLWADGFASATESPAEPSRRSDQEPAV